MKIGRGRPSALPIGSNLSRGPAILLRVPRQVARTKGATIRARSSAVVPAGQGRARRPSPVSSGRARRRCKGRCRRAASPQEEGLRYGRRGEGGRTRVYRYRRDLVADGGSYTVKDPSKGMVSTSTPITVVVRKNRCDGIRILGRVAFHRGG